MHMHVVSSVIRECADGKMLANTDTQTHTHTHTHKHTHTHTHTSNMTK